MPSKSLKITWGLLNFALLAVGVIAVAFSIVWRAPNVVINFIISEQDLNGGLALGIMLIVTWMVSVGAILQPNHVTIGLVATNWALIGDAITIVVVGGSIWLYTLTSMTNYMAQWEASSTTTIQALQDTLSCCGYTNSTQDAVFAGFCANTTFAASQVGCSSVIMPQVDYTLNNIFSSIFGFMAVVIAFFWATVCMVYRRKQQERFRLIDEKRGGKSFV